MSVIAGRSKAWIPWAVVNALIVFFGASYVWFPGEAVVAAGYETFGVVHVPSALWGAYVMASAASLLVVAVIGLRRNEGWARRAAFYEFVFFFLVAAIEPDPVVPSIFAVILGYCLWRLYRAASGPSRASAPAEALAG